MWKSEKVNNKEKNITFTFNPFFSRFLIQEKDKARGSKNSLKTYNITWELEFIIFLLYFYKMQKNNIWVEMKQTFIFFHFVCLFWICEHWEKLGIIVICEAWIRANNLLWGISSVNVIFFVHELQNSTFLWGMDLNWKVRSNIQPSPLAVASHMYCFSSLFCLGFSQTQTPEMKVLVKPMSSSVHSSTHHTATRTDTC